MRKCVKWRFLFLAFKKCLCVFWSWIKLSGLSLSFKYCFYMYPVFTLKKNVSFHFSVCVCRIFKCTYAIDCSFLHVRARSSFLYREKWVCPIVARARQEGVVHTLLVSEQWNTTGGLARHDEAVSLGSRAHPHLNMLQCLFSVRWFHP